MIDARIMGKSSTLGNGRRVTLDGSQVVFGLDTKDTMEHGYGVCIEDSRV